MPWPGSGLPASTIKISPPAHNSLIRAKQVLAVHDLKKTTAITNHRSCIIMEMRRKNSRSSPSHTTWP